LDSWQQAQDPEHKYYSTCFQEYYTCRKGSREMYIIRRLLNNYFFLSLFFLFSLSWNAFCDVETYYSIHVASFKELKRANNYVNKMASKGKVVFWKEADVPGKGQYYRVYLGKYHDREKAVEFWHILDSQGSVSYFGVHKFSDEPFPVLAKELPGEEPADLKKSDQVSSLKTADERFIDNQNGTVTDKKTKLMWTKNGWRMDFFSAATWKEAMKKCETFSLGGFKNWRLPTISEWKSLMDRKMEYPALTEPNPFENIIVHMPYWSGTEYVSKQAASLKSSVRAYTVMLYYGRIGHQNINKRAFIMPVRSIE
jgi:hypothetical protein